MTIARSLRSLKQSLAARRGGRSFRPPVKVTLDRTFPMPAGPDVAWGVLQDIEAVAACMPGAKITERIDASTTRAR